MMYRFKKGVTMGDLIRTNPKKDMFIAFLENSEVSNVNDIILLDSHRFTAALNITEGMVEFCTQRDLLKNNIQVKDIQVVVENKRSKTQTRLGTLDDSFDIILENKNTPPGFSYTIFELSKQGIYRYSRPDKSRLLTQIFDSSVPKEFWSADELEERIRIMN